MCSVGFIEKPNLGKQSFVRFHVKSRSELCGTPASNNKAMSLVSRDVLFKKLYGYED